jgi:phage/plasmid-associated DNA primase
MRKEIGEDKGGKSDIAAFYTDKIKRLGASRFRVEIERELAKLNGILRNSDDKNDFKFDAREKIKETITLLDGVLDFSGRELVFRESKPEEFRQRRLPYTTEQVKTSSHIKFDEYMRRNFKDKDTLEMTYYYISLIPSMVQYKYGAFFIGKKNAGKSTFTKLLKAIYGYLTGLIPAAVLTPRGQTFSEGNGPTPYIAALYGLGAAFVNESAEGAVLNEALWKSLTGNDEITGRGLNEAPKEFINTAQIIVQTNVMPKFNQHDAAIIERMIVVPFLVQHERDDENIKQPDDIVNELRPEFPGVVRELAEYYIKLKYEEKGRIPVSTESERYKTGYISDLDTDVDTYIKSRLAFEKDAIEKCSTVYEDYLSYCELDVDAVKRGAGASRAAFTRFLNKYYKEQYKFVETVKRFGKETARCFIGLRLKTTEEMTVESADSQEEKPEIPEENPFG